MGRAEELQARDSQAADRPPTDDDPGNPSVDFHGERRRNDTHQSTSDLQARLARKGAGKEAKLSYTGHVLMDNRNGLAVNCCVTKASGRAEAQAAVAMVEQIPGWRRITVGADKGYDSPVITERSVKSWCWKCASIELRRTSRVNQPVPSMSVLRATPVMRSVSASAKRVEEIFGWVKTVGGLRKTRHRGVDLVDWMFTLALAAYNLVRIRNLASAPT